MFFTINLGDVFLFLVGPAFFFFLDALDMLIIAVQFAYIV